MKAPIKNMGRAKAAIVAEKFQSVVPKNLSVREVTYPFKKPHRASVTITMV